MRTPCWTCIAWLGPTQPNPFALSLVITVAVAGCASAMSRKKSSISHWNQSVESSATGLAGAPAAQQGDGPVPIGPEEVARFPHLAPYRGDILLARENLQIVASGEQSDWTVIRSSGTVPVILAAFEAGLIDGKKTFTRNTTMGGVSLRVECPSRCPSGLGVRLEGLEEAVPGAGLAGISLALVSNLPVTTTQSSPANPHVPNVRQNTPVARLSVSLGGVGPGVFVELLPDQGTNLRLASEFVTPGGTVLPVREGDLVEGGDAKRISYVQFDGQGGQFLILPGPGSQVSLLPGKSVRIDGAAQAARWWLYAGGKAVQAGFQSALEQELGSAFRSRQVSLEGAVQVPRMSSPADTWLTNDSGDPLLMLNLGRDQTLSLPVETWSMNETAIPFVLRTSGVQTGERIGKSAGSLFSVQPESLEQVSLYGQPTATSDGQVPAPGLPDMVAVVPLGPASEMRRVLMRYVPADGLELTGPGMASVHRWPVTVQLPYGVYEAFFFSRSRGLICRVPFDVSRLREPGSVPSVYCGLAQRAAAPGRLPVMDGASIVMFDPDQFAVVRNQVLGVDFKVFPAPDDATRAILRGLGSQETDDGELEARFAPSGVTRTILIPCPLDRGLLESLRFTQLGRTTTTFAIPARNCASDFRENPWGVIEEMRAKGMDVRVVPPPGVSQWTSNLDAVFPLEPIIANGSGSATDGVRPAGIPDGLGRGGTFISIGSARRIDTTRVQVPVRIGRAVTGSRYLDPPWKLRRIRVISEGEVLVEVPVDPKRQDYPLSFKLETRGAIKQSVRHFRVELAARVPDTLGAVLGVADDFVVAESQMVDMK